MNAETVNFSNDLQLAKEDIIKRLRALEQTIEVDEREFLAGHMIEAKSSNENIPTVTIILNEINNGLLCRLEITGNITQYIVDEIVTFLQKNFTIAYIEVTDIRSGLIKFSLPKKAKDANLFEIYKRELFKFHYPRDDGRLVVLYDQNSFWTFPVVKTISKQSVPMKKALMPKVLSSKKAPLSAISPIKKKEVSLKVSKESKDLLTEETVPKKTETPLDIETQMQKKISRPKLDLSQKEQTILKLVESKPNKKVQSKGLRKELPAMDQDAIRNVLRSLVAKGLLYVRSAWYIVKEDPSEDTWDIASETPIAERLLSLTPKERRIYEILEKRPGNKAQARMLIKETKMTKENLKKLLRNMVAKDVLFVYAAWYCIKE